MFRNENNVVTFRVDGEEVLLKCFFQFFPVIKLV